MGVTTRNETRKNILKGATLLYDAVKTTMGPKGGNVLIKDKFGTFTITHDGVTVAKAVQAKGEPQEIGVDLLKEASKEMDKIGDGTTTVTVLTYHLIKELFDLIKIGMNPMIIKRALELIPAKLIAEIERLSIPVSKNKAEVFDIAFVSCQNKEIAEMISTLVVGTGYEGTIAVSTTTNNETTSELVEGYRFLSGYADSKFVTDGISREAIINAPAVILIDGVMDTMENYQNILIELKDKGIIDIVIVTGGIEPDLLTNLVLNKSKRVLNLVVIKNYFGREYLNDLSVVTGAKVYESTSEDQLDMKYVGRAEKVVVTAEETLIFGGKGDATSYIKALKALPTTDMLERRIGALNGKIGTIKVGGVTDTEAEEKKHRVDDAVAATRAALKGGIVAGGGVTLRDITSVLDEEEPIIAPVITALRQSEIILLENSGYTLNQSTTKKGYGLNVTTGEVVNMVKTGIIDPTIVTTEVIRNAFSVAGTAITVEAAIVEPPISQEELARLMEMAAK